MEQNETAIYVFCFARPGLLGELTGTSVDGHHPLSVSHHSGNVCAVLSEIMLEDFCSPAAERHMEELSWIAERAMRHEAVVEEVMAVSPVLPLRFGTLFSSRKALEDFLEKHGEAITRFLERVAEQKEWSVKGLLDRKQALQALTVEGREAKETQFARLPAGTRYLREQRIRQDAERELDLWLKQMCGRVASELRELASDFRECPVISRELSESGIGEVLNWAFLLSNCTVATFRQSIDRINADQGPRGLVFLVSGPWPPYRFVPPLSMAT